MDILIVGCGIAGPAFASFLLLTDQKHRITIVERSSSLRKAGQNIDIRGAGVPTIRKLGVEEAIRAATTGEEGALGVDEDNVIWGRFAADKTGRIQTGTSDIEILRGRLADILYQRCKEISDIGRKRGGTGVDFIFGEQVEDIKEDGTVKLRGQRRSFDLIVGADGLQSTVRKQVFGDHFHPLGLYGAFFSMPAGPTDSQWRRWLHSPGGKSIMIRPSDDPKRSTVFMPFKCNKKPEGQPKDVVARVFKDVGWESERVLREMYAADDFYYDAIAQVRMEKWSKGKVVLLADAGYCASPLSGMGTTLALTGAYNLAGALANSETAFEVYEAEMRPIVDKAQKMAPGFPGILFPETAWGVKVLRWLMWSLSASNVGALFAMFAGPPANEVPIKDYGIPEWSDWKLK